ncbi:MAG: squalene synthase HpnC, partial [Solirubrobacteraceae bacterium]
MTVLEVDAASALPTREDVMARAGSENFPVASLVLGRERRAHLFAIYGFARLVDQVGDDVAGNRLALLDAVSSDLRAIWDDRWPEHPVLRALAPTVAACSLPHEPFERLIEANRVDQRVSRYETFDDLLGYCRLSAAPVGELVLGVFGAATAQRIALSDRVCAGLQVVEHLQDVAEDFRAGRVYLPAEDLRRFGCGDDDLSAPTASPQLRRVIACETARSRELLGAGVALARTLPLRPRLAVAAVGAGGRAAVAALARSAHDVLGARPRRRRA